MKKSITTLLLLLLFVLSLSAQNYNPFVSSPSIAPSPMPDLQSNGTALFTFTIGNSGTMPMPVVGSQALKISMSLLRGIPNTAGTPPNGVSGSWAQYFSWSFDNFTKTLTGTQVQTLPANDSGTITLDYLVTSNSTVTSPQNGFNINLTPPAYSAGANLQGDDNISAFAYTVPVVTGPNYNPFVSAPSIAPSPMPDVQSNGSALFSFTVGNTGSMPMPVTGNQALIISMSLLRGIPNTAGTPPNGVSGSWAQYFSWSFDTFTKVLTGTQIQTLPANDSGTITLDYLVTSNSTVTSPQNGFNINLTPPAYSAGANLQGDDNISAFGYTVPVVTGPNYNPFVSAPSIAPSPMPDVQSNGSALFSFTVGNTGSMPMPVTGNQALVISMSLLRGIPNTAGTPPNGVSGSWAQYFSWSFDSFTKVLTGTQIQTLPANDSGTITLDYLVTSNSTVTSPQNGFNINLTPPAYSAGANLQGDDNISAFAYTVPVVTVPNYNPFVSAPSIAPSPMPDLQSNGSALFTFTVGNTGSMPMPVTGNQALVISMSLLRGIPNAAGTPPNGVSGSWAQYFSWSFDSFTKILTGTQIQTLPANDSGTIILDYLVTSNSTVSSPQNGFNINLIPPAYSTGSNLQGDDNINAFAYTVPVVTVPNYNPFVSSPVISPTPIPDVQANGSAQFTYTIGNSGTMPMPVTGNQALVISMPLLGGILNSAATPPNGVSGSWAQYFSWSFDNSTNILTGTQIQTLPANDAGSITVDYLVTSNSTVSNPQNGFTVNLIPPAYSVGANLQGDDNINSFTHTVPVGVPNITLGAIVSFPSIAISGNTAVNYYVNNTGTGPTTGSLIDIIINKPSDGTLVLPVTAGWTVVADNAAFIRLNSNNIIQPGLANSVILTGFYYHGGVNQTAIKSTHIIVAPGSGGETITNDNQAVGFIQIN